ncbi:MAG: VWA domain-containing protein [Gammaproteobacteria bacterium]|nr:VWA domain-containing protein [Gammaproteobacteria bacterium]
MSEFALLRPWWLLLIPPALALIWWTWRNTDAASRWRALIDPGLLPHLLHRSSERGSKAVPLYASMLAVLCALALAGPSFQHIDTAGYRSLRARIVILDLSSSMLTPDIAPSRLDRAREKARLIMQRSREALSGVVVFAGAAFVVSPLTEDAGTLIEQLPALLPDIMPVQGSRLDSALARAAQLLQEGGATHGDLILITDGPNNERNGPALGPGSAASALAAAAALDRARITLSVIGVGSPDGAPIPLAEGGFLRDGNGRLVRAGLNERALAEMARHGGGLYIRASTDERDVEQILALHDGVLERSEYRNLDRHIPDRYDHGAWLLPVLLLLVLPAFRRGWLMSLLLVAALSPVQRVSASDWQGWLLGHEHRAAAAIERGDYAHVEQLKVGPHWRGAAHYRAGRYAAAVEAFAQLGDATGHYNRGNALALSGQLEAAVGAYEQALRLEPTHEDARFNLTLVRRAMDSSSGRGNDRQRAEPAAASSEPHLNQDRGRRTATATREAGDNRGARTTADEQASSRQPGEEPANAHDSAYPSMPADRPEAGPEPGTDSTARSGADGEPPPARWLDRIPDEPGGLLKQKFHRTYFRRHTQAENTGDPW